MSVVAEQRMWERQPVTTPTPTSPKRKSSPPAAVPSTSSPWPLGMSPNDDGYDADFDYNQWRYNIALQLLQEARPSASDCVDCNSRATTSKPLWTPHATDPLHSSQFVCTSVHQVYGPAMGLPLAGSSFAGSSSQAGSQYSGSHGSTGSVGPIAPNIMATRPAMRKAIQAPSTAIIPFHRKSPASPRENAMVCPQRTFQS